MTGGWTECKVKERRGVCVCLCVCLVVCEEHKLRVYGGELRVCCVCVVCVARDNLSKKINSGNNRKHLP